MQKQLEKSATSSTDHKAKPSDDEDKKDYRSVAPPHKFSDAAYDEQKKQISDDMNEAVQIAAQLIQAEKRKKKKSSTAISTNDDESDNDDNVKETDGNEATASSSSSKKRRHSEDNLEDGELKNKKTKKVTGADAAFFLGIDVDDLSTDDDEDDDDVSAKKKKVAKKI